MKTKQAKDFLVQQADEQAAQEGVPLSDIEKMYFTESNTTSCNLRELNDEFEAQYDTPEYEAKISWLLLHAYERLKGEDPERVREWNLAIRTLRRGDNYILVLWDSKPPNEHPIRDFLKFLGVGMLFLADIFIVIIVQAKYNISFDRISFDRFRKYLPAPESTCGANSLRGNVCPRIGGFTPFQLVAVDLGQSACQPEGSKIVAS